MQFILFEPQSDWQPPEILPDLSSANIIALDCETRDPNLKTRGPGGVRKDGHVAGVSLATDTGITIYLPIGHQAGGNLDKGLVKRYLKAQLGREHQEKVGANLLYDLEWLKCDLDVDVKGQLYDVQAAEPLIDENNRSYSLERISRKYLGEGKDETLLKQATQAFFGKAGGKGDMWKLHSKYVGPYGEGDAYQTLHTFLAQREILHREGLWSIFLLEMRLLRVMFYMRLTGVPVDVARAERSLIELQRREAEAQKELNYMVGMNVNVWAANSLQAAYDHKGIQYPKLLTGNASFTQEWLKEQKDILSTKVLNVRKINRMWSTFVKGQVLDHHINGIVYCQFHANRGDSGGTVTGRFSSSNPNLQQVPSPEKDPVLASFARSLFIPSEGCDWHCDDFSQIEPRIQLHYAIMRGHTGAAEAAEIMVKEGLDFHTLTANITGLPRKKAKTINLGLSYGMGVAKLALDLGVTEFEAKEILAQYHGNMPFLKGITQEVNTRAEQQGYIKTLLGRKRRFDLWEGGRNQRGQALPSRAEAIEKYGLPVRRAFTHKAFNALIQGSAADVIKKVMVDIYESGVIEAGAQMHLTVHDELDFSVPRDKPELGKEIVNIMENSVKLSIPFKVDNEIGPSWGEVKKAS